MKIPKDYIETIEGYKQFRDKLDDVLNDIDFEKIAEVMKYLNWTWGTFKDDYGNLESRIPTAKEIREESKRLFIDCVEKAKYDIWKISTGGITVKTVVYDPDDSDIDSKLREELMNNPADFNHRVDLLFSFSIEESIPMY